MATSSHTPGDDENALAQPSHSSVVRLSYGPETLQFGELHLPAGSGPFPTVILIHGGFWRNPYGYTLMTSLAEDLAKQGIAAWNIEYRRVGDAGGGWPSTLLDVARPPTIYAALLPLGVPQVLIHGTEDDRVPYIMSEEYAQAARAAGDQVTLIKLEGADHFVLINVYSDAWARTVQSVRQLVHLE